MRRLVRTFAGAALLLTLPGLTLDAFAHGGAYRGPAGEVPENSREPEDPPPPPEGDGPTTPGGETDGPTTPGGDVDGPTTPGGDTSGPGSGGSSPGAPPTTPGGGTGGPRSGPGGRPQAKGPGYADWTFWWTYNKDEILRLRDALRARPAGTGNALHAPGARHSAGAVVSVSQAVVRERIVPALRTMLAERDLNFDIQSAAALALAKIGDTSQIPTLFRMVRNERSDGYHRVVQESAALALGLLQADTAEVREFLVDVVTQEPRDASFTRPFAAVSLGLLGSEGDAAQASREALLRVVARKEQQAGMKAAALLGIGLLGDERAVPELLALLEPTRGAPNGAALDDVERAFVVQALGKIGAAGTPEQPRAVVDALTERLTGRSANKTDRQIRRSAVIALGQIGAHADPALRDRVLKTLRDAVREDSDESVTTFGVIAMGRIGAELDATDARRGELIRALRHHMQKGQPAHLVPQFAGLALGLVGHDDPIADEENLRAPIRAEFADRGDPRARGAFAIASGLLHDPLAVDELVATLSDRGLDARLRAYAAVALGMIGDDRARGAVRTALADDSDRGLRVQTAVAAGLLGDRQAVSELVKIAGSRDESQFVLGSVALALGQIGDESAVDPLLEIATDPQRRYPDITRALATVALGQLGDRSEVPALTELSTDINFRALGAVPPIVELLTIL